MNEPSTLFYEGSPYHTETIPLNCCANQCTGFCMIGNSVMKELNSNDLDASFHRQTAVNTRVFINFSGSFYSYS